MCQLGCIYEDRDGDCARSHGMPCPNGEIELKGWEAALLANHKSWPVQDMEGDKDEDNS